MTIEPQRASDHIRTSYDLVAQVYAERFAGELAHKPLDRELLRRFASEIRGGGYVYDLGCGPGHTTGLLHECGASVRGMDLSPEILKEARKRHPDIEFEAGDMLALPLADASAAGIVAFYAIVHFSPTDLRQALKEMHRVLKPGGLTLVSFHIGEGSIHVDEFLGHSVSLDFELFSTQALICELSSAGFEAVEAIERDPYPEVEYPSRRGDTFVRKPDDFGISSGASEQVKVANRPPKE